MKATIVFGLILMFLFVGFRPPQGMRKFPTANIEFQAPAESGTYTASAK